MFSFISERNIISMLRGNAIAVVMIAVTMIIVLRSFGLGLFSLIPNTIPILLTFGVWALFVGQIGMSSATVSATALGIIVDDSVHFLVKYLIARREKGLTKAQSIHYAFETVGRAIIATTLILSIGFMVLYWSTFKITVELGVMTALAIVIALIIDLFLLPALLLLLSDQKETQSKEIENENVTAYQTA